MFRLNRTTLAIGIAFGFEHIAPQVLESLTEENLREAFSFTEVTERSAMPWAG